MNRLVWCLFVLFAVVVNSNKVYSEIVKCHQDQIAPESVSGFALELLLNSQESLKKHLLELQLEVQELRASTAENQNNILKRLETGLEKMSQLERNNQQIHDRLSDIERLQLDPLQSCQAAPSKVSGKYKIQPNEQTQPFVAYCEQELFQGGWMVIQHRIDGALDFKRNWTDYRNGFGQVGAEMWLGLERVHQMTAAQPFELLVELKDFEGNYKYARYRLFAIDSEAEQYRLKTLGAYTGTAGDSLSTHKGMRFSTMDRDNDNIADYSCAEEWDGGWWFDKCFKAFLNGRYRNFDEHKITWYTFHDKYQGLNYTRMSIRPMN